MNNKQVFFPIDDLENYNILRALFLLQLTKTEERCIKICDSKYDQERHYSVSILPDVESNRLKIKKSKLIILTELNSIEKYSLNSAEKLKKLIYYGVNLSKMDFHLLFMRIFSGKLQKRWAPMAEAHANLKKYCIKEETQGFTCN